MKIKVGGTIGGSGHLEDGVKPLPFPFPDVLAEDFINLANQGIAAGWAATEEAQELCGAACFEAGLDWNGTAYADGTYEFGEMEFFEEDDGTLGYSVEAEYEVELGCNCGG